MAPSLFNLNTIQIKFLARDNTNIQAVALRARGQMVVIQPECMMTFLTGYLYWDTAKVQSRTRANGMLTNDIPVELD